MEQRNRHFGDKAFFAHSVRTAFRLAPLLVLVACGGGGGSAAGTSAVPVSLGAALPDEGNYLALSQATISLSESSRKGTVSVARHGVAQGASSVHYRMIPGTASAGQDYRAIEGQLQWADGESTARDIEFVVNSDMQDEGVESFQIEIYNVEGTDTLGVNDRTSVQLQDSACNVAFPLSVSSNTRLNAPCYRLAGAAKVTSSAQLQMGAGTTVVAEAGASLTFTHTATLDLQGQAENPVVLKGASEQAGFWQGISLLGTSALHRINHADISHAYHGVAVVAGAMATIERSTFQHHAGAGISLPLSDAENLAASNTFVASKRGIELVGSSIAANEQISLPVQSTHYTFANGLVNSGILSIGAGTDIRMARDVNVLVLGTGSIQALGSADQPIKISGLEPQAGFWNGIQYVSSTSESNRYTHVSIAHGGGDPARSGNIIVAGLGTRISLQNCVLSHSAGHGIVYDSSAFQVDLDAVNFEQNRLGDQSL